MPKRHNSFQDAVAHVHRFLAHGQDVTIDEGVELVDRDTGGKREVDVVIRSTIAGQRVTVCVEAFRSGRGSDVQKVEQLIKKHENLETSQLVLVCDTGFSEEAWRKAVAENVTLLVPDELPEGDEGPRLGAIESLWLKTLSLTVTGVRITVQQPDGERWFRSAPDVMLFDGQGSEVMHAITAAFTITQKMGLPEPLREVMADVTDHREGKVTVDVIPFEPSIDGVPSSLHCRWEESDPHRLDRIVKFTVDADYVIDVQPEAEITTTSISGVQVAYAETKWDKATLRVFDLFGNGESRAFIRVREGSDYRDVELTPELPHGPFCR